MKRRTTADFPSSLRELTAIPVELLEQLFDPSADVTFFVKDAAGRYLAVNESLAARHGYTKQQVLGKRPSDICPGDLGKVPADQDALIIRTGQALVNHLELHWYKPDQAGWCLTTKLPIREESGRITGIIGLSRDVRVPVEADEIPAEFAAAIAAFERDLERPLTPATLARAARMTSSRLARLTKRLFGLTPSHWITKTRIAAAARLLRDTNDSVSRVAITCGYADQSAFCRAFRAATGVTPGDYRRALSSAW